MTEEVKTEAEKGQEQMDAANLFREEIYTGEAQIMTQMGALPISFDIEADNLAAAVANYREAAKTGVEKTMKELQELRRAAASKIVVPGQPGFTPPEGAGGSGLVMP